jgi:hypothetical protein
MNRSFQKIARIATIVVSFVEAAHGSLASAAVFWMALFSAAVMNEPDDEPRHDDGRRLM